MKLFHKTCKTELFIITTGIVVRVDEFSVKENSLAPVLLDLETVKKGTFIVRCKYCKTEVDNEEEILGTCGYCGCLVPITEACEYGPQHPILCAEHDKLVWQAYSKLPYKSTARRLKLF